MNWKIHQNLLKRLLGTQRGGLQGTDLIFITKNYFNTQLNITSSYYKETIGATIGLELRKEITNMSQIGHKSVDNTYEVMIQFLCSVNDDDVN